MSLKHTIPLGQLHKDAVAHLNGYSESARLDADLIICHILNISRSALITQDQTEIENSQAEQIQALLDKRKDSYPMAYITGTRHFWDLELAVNAATLIPRPETELLVETALRNYHREQAIKVLDLGTGSGAIAIAIAKARANWTVLAGDNSTAALEVASRNAAAYQLTNVQFINSHWFNDVSTQHKFELILSNPPYIEQNDPHLKQGDVQYEPLSALSSGIDGLDDIRQLIPAAKDFLKPSGWLWLEHGFDQAGRVKDLFNKHNYTQVKQHMDLSGHTRITGAQLNQ